MWFCADFTFEHMNESESEKAETIANQRNTCNLSIYLYLDDFKPIQVHEPATRLYRTHVHIEKPKSETETN